MVGRVTSHPPAVNVHGVPYKTLMEREREHSSRLIGRYRQALQLWLDAYAAEPASQERRLLLKQARQRTARVMA